MIQNQIRLQDFNYFFGHDLFGLEVLLRGELIFFGSPAEPGSSSLAIICSGVPGITISSSLSEDGGVSGTRISESDDGGVGFDGWVRIA